MKTKKTKIVATIGPASSRETIIRKLAAAGMNVARLNFSHGDHPSHLEKINILQGLIHEGINLSIMLDTKGPEIRTHYFEQGEVEFFEGDHVRITMKEVLGTRQRFSVTYPGLFHDLDIGNRIRLDDGRITFEVIAKDFDNEELVCLVHNQHRVRDRRNVVAPFARLNMPYISSQDEQDLIFGCEHGIDYVAASFARRPDDIRQIRSILNAHHGERIQIIAKIENQEGVDHFAEILAEADGIMVARGDLGVEISPEEVPVVQKMIVKECRKAGKPVIVATHMLDSMQHSPNPTRAEVSDVANAVFESCDAIMLSGESASGSFPVESVLMESKIARRMEEILDYRLLAQEGYPNATNGHYDAIAFSVANLLLLSDIELVVAFSKSGATARRLAKFRPDCPVVALSTDPQVARSLGLTWGVYGFTIPSVGMESENERLAMKIAKQFGVHAGQHIVITGGNGQGSTNLIKLITVE
ncbi:MAG: pyruvate kinase [Bacilli bacterium]